jgi:hypothetical protein
VVVGASIVMALQTIVARNVPPLHTGIITVGAFLAGDAPNVIPGTAELRLTVRAMQPTVRDLLERRISELAQAQAASYGATAEVNYIRRYPVLNNTPEHTDFCKQLVRDWLGEDGLVVNPEPITASEDFAFFLEKVPGCYINIGNGMGSVGGCMVHNAGVRLQRPGAEHRRHLLGEAGRDLAGGRSAGTPVTWMWSGLGTKLVTAPRGSSTMPPRPARCPRRRRGRATGARSCVPPARLRPRRRRPSCHGRAPASTGPAARPARTATGCIGCVGSGCACSPPRCCGSARERTPRGSRKHAIGRPDRAQRSGQ